MINLYEIIFLTKSTVRALCVSDLSSKQCGGGGGGGGGVERVRVGERETISVLSASFKVYFITVRTYVFNSL